MTIGFHYLMNNSIKLGWLKQINNVCKKWYRFLFSLLAMCARCLFLMLIFRCGKLWDSTGATSNSGRVDDNKNLLFWVMTFFTRPDFKLNFWLKLNDHTVRRFFSREQTRMVERCASCALLHWISGTCCVLNCPSVFFSGSCWYVLTKFSRPFVVAVNTTATCEHIIIGYWDHGVECAPACRVVEKNSWEPNAKAWARKWRSRYR